MNYSYHGLRSKNQAAKRIIHPQEGLCRLDSPDMSKHVNLELPKSLAPGPGFIRGIVDPSEKTNPAETLH